jgi:hypothetical protein
MGGSAGDDDEKDILDAFSSLDEDLEYWRTRSTAGAASL